MTRRSQAREVALLLLFQLDLNPEVSREDVVAFARTHLAEQEEAIAFALALYDGAVAARAAIDERLAKAAENWRISRMATIDRNILRLGAHELTASPDLPVGVVFNEAIELARRYGSADSPAFVNGVLDRLHRERGEPAAVAVPPSPEPSVP
ncbi:MAG: transcription antitermination factor NusB [Gemmataceae bacterium]